MSHADRIMILLVDDRPENLLAYQASLAELDLELVFAGSGTEALKQVLAHEFALVLLDVNMPGMDGFETAGLIRNRKRSAHTPIIFVTAFPDEVHATQGYAYGAVDYLQSPVVPEILRAKVKVFVDLFRMAREVKRQSEERLALAQERMRRAAAEEANSRLTFLAEVTAVVGRSLDDTLTARDTVRLTVPTLGDHAVIARRDPTGSGWQIIQAVAEAGAVSIEQFTSVEDVAAPLGGALVRTLESGAIELLQGSSPAPSGEARIVVFPLSGQKSILAALGISREPSGRHFTPADFTIAEALASRAAIALENAQLYKDLEHADRQKNEFLSMLAHELRNPLAPIRTGVEVLRLRGDTQPELIWAREMIERQTMQLVRLVDDLLDVSRITGGKIRIEMECVDVAAIVATAIETSRPLIDEASHALTVSIPDATLCVNCDRVRLAQVLSNLLNNAAKYTRSGGAISLSVASEDSEVVFRVRDNGIGIPPEMLSKIFDLFTQIERSLDRSRGGLGVGLTLARRLVQLHGGSIDVASEGPGQGSEFTVRLPAILPPGTGGALRTGPATAESVAHAPLRILVVDDNVDAADSVAWLFRQQAHDVRTTHDGRSAIELATEFRPQVVVLDLGLPQLDGYEVSRRLRKLPDTRDSLIIAVSGYGQDEDRRRSSQAGFDHHFIKPVDFQTLMGVLREAENNRSPDEEFEGVES
jgi:signal transduction histidine kinase/DNA-binding response OmpR family regulator